MNTSLMPGDICVICQDDLSGAPSYTLPECNHTCHVECLINWFRSPRDWDICPGGYGTCPICRCAHASPYRYFTVKGRVSAIRKLSRKKNAHPYIKKYISKLKELEAEQSQARRNIKNFIKIHKDGINELKKLRRKRWSVSRRLWKIKGEIATFDPLSV